MQHRLAFLDLDGVIADETHRSRHALAKDWGRYFCPYQVARDGVFRQGRELYECTHLAGFDVAYLTGRREDLRGVTEQWLARHHFDAGLPLVMRLMRHLSRDGWKLPVLKARIVSEALHIYDEVHLWDDDPAVVEAVRQVPGARAHHCTWHEKPEAMVRRGVT